MIPPSRILALAEAPTRGPKLLRALGHAEGEVHEIIVDAPEAEEITAWLVEHGYRVEEVRDFKPPAFWDWDPDETATQLESSLRAIKEKLQDVPTPKHKVETLKEMLDKISWNTRDNPPARNRQARRAEAKARKGRKR